MVHHTQLAREQIRLLILYDFKSGISAAQSHQRICAAFGQHAVGKTAVHDWYKRFSEGEQSLEDAHHTGRPAEIDDRELQLMIEAEPKLTTTDLAEHFEVSSTAINNHLHQLGKVFKQGKWVPHDLTQFDHERRIDASLQNLATHRTVAHLKNIITGDEKWVLYYNVTRRGQWLSKGEAPEPTAKAPLSQRKVMLCLWWNYAGIVHWELLPRNTTVTADVYIQQLDRLNQALQQKHPKIDKVEFLHDNAPAHRSKQTSQKLLELGWTVLNHPPYSPDLAPSDYYLFRSLQNHIADMKFDDDEQVKIMLTNFFESKQASFFERGINKLVERWQWVIEHNGDYYPD